MSFVLDTPPRNSDGQFTYAPGTEARADAVLSKILGTPAPSAAPEPNTEAAPVAAPVIEPAPEGENTPAKADEVLTYAGFTPSMQAKLSPEERLALVTHHKAENAKAKAQAERLNQLEKATQAPAVETPAPAPQRTSEDFTKAAEPLVEILGLEQEHLPTIAAFAKTIADTVRAELTPELGYVSEYRKEVERDIASSTMKVLGERFPQLSDAAIHAKVKANVDMLASTGRYAASEYGSTAKDRAVRLWTDAAKLADITPAQAVNTQQRDSARDAGQVSPAQKVVAPVGETNQQRIDRLALKWANAPV